MYTRKNYSVVDMLLWTRQELVLFLLVSAVPVFVYEFLDQKWLHLPWLPIALIGTAVAFVIGFQNNASYGRLWEARKIWGGITNTSRAWGTMLNDFVTNQFAERPADEAELGAIRKEMVFRHVAWLTALRHAMRQPRPWERFLKHKTNREWGEKIGIREHRTDIADEVAPYLDPDEGRMVCAKTNKPAQILAIQSRRLRELRGRGLIDDFRHMEMQNVLVQLYDLQGRSERIKNFPYPRQYATLNLAFLWIFILLLPFGVMSEFDAIGEELVAAYPAVGDSFVWASVPFAMLVMWVFHTMERIGRVTENPFEGSPNDVPITTMSRAIEIDLREMIDDDPGSIPAPIEPVHHTQT